MVFSSPTFLFLFLPGVLLLHTALPPRARNALLLVASLLFYTWGELAYTAVMLASIAMNAAAGRALEAGRLPPRRVLGFAVAANLLLLGVFKYANFVADNLSVATSALGLGPVELAPVHLPIGISFFTFQAISFLVDLHRGEVREPTRPLRLGLFISLFPQLIAGPILRYRDLAPQIAARRVDLGGFAEGVRRFSIGLAKKVLIADTLAGPADRIFALGAGELDAGVAWFGVACYTLQIYFDFSGYSDMAIGLGRMLGFRIPENFRHPYAAASIRDFWRRWHISLSTWFRDYLYVPLGGSRGGALRTGRNLLLVFLLCGLWHGASWSFVVWGLFHGAFLVAERAAPRLAVPRPLAHLYVLAVVMVAWVFFRADDLPHALAMLGAMLPLGGSSTAAPGYLVDQADGAVLAAFAAGVLGATPWWAAARDRLDAWRERAPGRWAGAWDGLGAATSTAGIAAVWLACATQLAVRTFDPFIYFRF